MGTLTRLEEGLIEDMELLFGRILILIGK